VETFADKVARLQREIAIRQAELHRLVCGNPAKGVSGPKPIDWPEYLELKD
jgi:hypothetical protein